MRRTLVNSIVSMTLLAVLTSSAEAVYHPTLGRWVTRDPIGYGGGLNFHAYANGDPVSSVDSMGLKIDIIEVSAKRDSEIPVDFAASLSNQRFSGYFNAVQEAIAFISDKVSDSAFASYVASGGVTFAGQPFTGTRQQYIEQIRRELESTHVKIITGGYPFLAELTSSAVSYNTQPYDQTIVGVHGVYRDRTLPLTQDGEQFVDPQPTNQVVITGEYENQAVVLAALRRIGAPLGGEPRFMLVSCFQDGVHTEGFSPAEGAGWKASPDEKCISFMPLKMNHYLDPTPQEVGLTGGIVPP